MNDRVSAARASSDDPLMPIGMFSTASLVSVKALRLYHEQGLLIPAEIDAASGYRFYRVSQLLDAQVIKRLRDLDLPLAAVATIVQARDPEVTRRVMADHQTLMRERLSELTRIVDQLQEAIHAPTLQTPPFIRTEPTLHTLAVTELVHNPQHDSYAAFLDSAYQRLWSTILRLGAVPVAASGALYPPKVEGDEEAITAFIPVAEPVVLDDEAQRSNVTNHLLAGTTCAVLTHSGAYQEMGDTYRRLGAWVASNGHPAELPVRELYVVSIDETTGKLLPDDELRTEIAWPVIAFSAT
jgi:DNA-binding transcriptional MerR regulator